MGKINALFTGEIILGTLILLISFSGCSDMPYTRSMLTAHEVDRYLVSTDGNVVCFQDDRDETCLKLGTGTTDPLNATNGPAIHIYPERRLYLFYHEGNPIFRAERIGDNNGNNDGNDDNSNDDNSGNNGNNNGNGGNNGNNGNNNGNGGNNGNNGNNNGDNNGNNNGNGGNNNNNNGDNNNNNNNNDRNNPSDTNDGHGWIIWIYYPEGATPKDSPSLSESGVTVTINGKLLTDADVTGFARFIGSNNEEGVQFFYPTQTAELLDLKVRIEGVDTGEEAKFNINYLWNSN